ncbi:MAG TPA: DNA mismatch repair protein MutT [Chitinophagaceae bacterium]|jgi:8-oxo-dGTP pyrophosphatase MutT (NUDIX family)|nr:DNA mismatch repair protein MutT [Chitinophagaceae bacterium]
MNDALKKLHTAGLVVLQDRKLLLAYSKRKHAFYLPGGKLDDGENAVAAIIREIKEELSIDLSPEELDFYCHISAPAYGEEPPVMMEQDCFLYTLKSTPVVNAEIEAVRFFSFTAFKKEVVQVPGVLLLFQQLIQDDKVDA